MTRDGRRRVLSYEERVLWTTVTQSMKPMRVAPVAPSDTGDVPIEPRKPPKPPGPMVKAARPKPAVDAPTPPSAKPIPIAPPLSRRAKRSVARGKADIDARLDLHGLTQSEAHHALLRFLRTASARGARLVLVITGKGKAGGDGERERGVLRRQVPQWLSLPEFRDYVVGFEDAHIAHGGEGALYVRVRRAKG